MYQQTSKVDLSHLGNPEEQFGKLLDIFRECTDVRDELVEPDNTEYDLSKAYTINWACIWNKPSNIGRKCIIVQKNDRWALVIFQDDTELTQDKIYRLEDLSI